MDLMKQTVEIDPKTSQKMAKMKYYKIYLMQLPQMALADPLALEGLQKWV